MLNYQALLNLFPEPSDEFDITASEYELILQHKDATVECVDVSLLSLLYEGASVYLKYISISENYKQRGYGTNILRELIKQCAQQRLAFYTDSAYEQTISIINKIVAELGYEQLYHVGKLDEEGEFSFIIHFDTNLCQCAAQGDSENTEEGAITQPKTIMYEEGQRVRISGEVYYGNSWYSVSSGGTIVKANKKSCLVCIDHIDGDGNATCTVQNKFIKN